jgi:autotransporter-associated beta strand protein
VNVSAGQSVVSVSTMTGNVAVSGLTLGNLVRATGGEVNFSGTNLGQNGFATTQVFLNQVNGGAISLANNILGGWATVNGTDFAGYVTSNGTQGGVGALNTLGFPYYSANLLSGTTTTSDNINVNATVTMAAGAKTINSLRIAGAYNLTIGTTDILTLSTGGLLANGASTISGGTITSGTSELFAYTNAAVTISSVLSGTGLSLVKGGASTLTLTGANTFTGTLYANQGTTTLNATGANGTTIVAAGGDLVLNNAAVTFSAVSQLKSTANVTLNGGATLTLTGSNTFNSVTFNNTGGIATPTITGGSLVLTTATLFSTNDSFSTTPTIASAVDLNAGARAISVNGLSPNGLSITGAISGGAGSLTKTGSSALYLGTTGRFDCQRQRRDIQKQNVLHVTAQHAALNRSAHGDHLIWVHALVRFLADDVARGLNDLGHTGHPAHEDEFVDVFLRKLGVRQTGADGLHRALKKIVGQLL